MNDVWKLSSGKFILIKLIDFEKSLDDHDKVNWSKWQYIGYKYGKPFAEMTWKEYLLAQKNN